MKKESPILFSTEMVRAILSGKKTQTRRIMTPIPEHRKNFEGKGGVIGTWFNGWNLDHPQFDIKDIIKHSRYGGPGDLLWVREAWAHASIGRMVKSSGKKVIVYKADNHDLKYYPKWKPSIHLKKIHSRIWLHVTNIRIERLNDISAVDAIAEGIEECEWDEVNNVPTYRLYDFKNAVTPDGPVESYRSLWQSINGKNSWNENPWVWIIEFKRIEKPKI